MLVRCCDHMMDIWNELPYEALHESNHEYWTKFWEPIENDEFDLQDLGKLYIEIESQLIPQVLKSTWTKSSMRAAWIAACRPDINASTLEALATILRYDAICWKAVADLRLRLKKLSSTRGSTSAPEDAKPKKNKNKVPYMASSPINKARNPRPDSQTLSNTIKSESVSAAPKRHQTGFTLPRPDSSPSNQSTSPQKSMTGVDVKPDDVHHSNQPYRMSFAGGLDNGRGSYSFSYKEQSHPPNQPQYTSSSHRLVKGLSSPFLRFKNDAALLSELNLKTIEKGNHEIPSQGFPSEIKFEGESYSLGNYSHPELALLVSSAARFFLNISTSDVGHGPGHLPLALPSSSEPVIRKIIELASMFPSVGMTPDWSSIRSALSAYQDFATQYFEQQTSIGGFRSDEDNINASHGPRAETHQMQEEKNLVLANCKTDQVDATKNTSAPSPNIAPACESSQRPSSRSKHIRDTTHIAEVPPNIVVFKDEDMLVFDVPDPVPVSGGEPSGSDIDEISYEGVYEWRIPFDERLPYYAKVAISNLDTYLGSYPTPEAAARVYDAALYLSGASRKAFNFPVLLPLVVPLASRPYLEQFLGLVQAKGVV
eukprot:TRINITY_DN4035_c0_g2_i2.p1 TRINITY_DN4035_c0_g2~~TRINITY_DN4035_c0_g2_i2.p1  ORF type:complete len:597 (+),score=98.36 TRINITY_DN4035_c0_g2_i2:653-2443(+)